MIRRFASICRSLLGRPVVAHQVRRRYRRTEGVDDEDDEDKDGERGATRECAVCTWTGSIPCRTTPSSRTPRASTMHTLDNRAPGGHRLTRSPRRNDAVPA
jgi:hypothetical protein